MATFVLVHGAWHGGWCWRDVARLLRSGGHEVHTPTLTGLGERAHLLGPGIDLETHVRDVLGVLEVENLLRVVLVGHSYGGIVVTAVADRAAARIARLVYLDAPVPRDGQSHFDCAPAHVRAHFEQQARVGGDGWRLPVAATTPQLLGLRRDEDAAWVMSKLTPHPLRTLREPVRLGNAWSGVPRLYINCIGDKPKGGPRTPQADGIGDYQELATGHDAMVTAPEALAALLARYAD